MSYKYGKDDGVSAGMKIWLIFIIGLSILGVPATLSIVFGALAGLSAGYLVAYWRAAPLPAEKGVTEQPIPESAFKRVQSGIGRFSLPSVSKLFGRKQRRYIGSPSQRNGRLGE